MAPFHDGQSFPQMERQIFGRTVKKKVLPELSKKSSSQIVKKKVLNQLFWAGFGQKFGKFWQFFFANFRQNIAFSLAGRFFPWQTFFLCRRRVGSKCRMAEEL